MGKWREEEVILPCGCKVGRSQQGLWFYDFICEEHLQNVQVDGKFNYEKSLEFTEMLQKAMKLLKAYKELGELMKQLSDTEAKAYLFIKQAEQPLAIRDMPHQLQGAVGKLTSKGIVERYRTQVKVSKHGFVSMKMTNCIKVASNRKV